MALVANSSGVVAGKFTIPAGIPAGAKAVRFQGSGGSNGQAVFTGQGTLTTSTLRQVTTVTVNRWDPLAQTFTLSEAGQLASVDLYFEAKGTTNVVVQVRETANGVPTQTVIAERRIKPADILLNNYTNIAFPSPVALTPGIEYALVALCDDGVTALKVGELGKWDDAAKKWVTSQPYQVGVLQSSSNGVTWTAHQDKDLTFALRFARYGQTQRVLNLGSVAVANATDLLLLTAEELPSAEAQIKYELVLPDASIVSVSDGQPVRLAAEITGNVAIRATLIGTTEVSPVLFPGTQLVVGRVATNGTYFSRAIKAGNNVRVKAILDVQLPAGASVTMAYKGGDVSDTWINLPFASASPVDDGFVENVYEAADVSKDQVQLRVTIAGTAAARVRARNLRFMTI